jgi:hypothetical protein
VGDRKVYIRRKKKINMGRKIILKGKVMKKHKIADNGFTNQSINNTKP